MSNKFLSSIILAGMLMMWVVILNTTSLFGDYNLYALIVVAIVSMINAGYALNAVIQEKKQPSENTN